MSHPISMFNIWQSFSAPTWAVDKILFIIIMLQKKLLAIVGHKNR